MNFGHSKLNDYRKCPQLFKLKHLDGLDDGGDTSPELSFGTAVHAGVQDVLEGGQGTDVFQMSWELAVPRLVFGPKARLSAEQLTSLGVTLVEIFRDEHKDKFVPAALEKTLTTFVGPHPYKGTVDFLGTYKGKPVMVDWKTSAMPYGPHKIEVDEQLYGYAYLAEKELGFVAEAVLYGVAVKDPKNPRWQFKEAPLSPKILQKKLDNIQVLCNTVSNTPKDGFYKNALQCVTGSYGNFRICPFYQRCHGQDDGETEKTAVVSICSGSVAGPKPDVEAQERSGAGSDDEERF